MMKVVGFFGSMCTVIACKCNNRNRNKRTVHPTCLWHHVVVFYGTSEIARNQPRFFIQLTMDNRLLPKNHQPFEFLTKWWNTVQGVSEELQNWRHITHFSQLWVVPFYADESINQQVCSEILLFTMFSGQEEVRIVAGQLVAASPWQHACSKCREHPTVPHREEHRCARIPSLPTWRCVIFVFPFPSSSEVIKGTPFWKCGWHQDGWDDCAAEECERFFQKCINKWQRRLGQVDLVVSDNLIFSPKKFIRIR